MAALLAALLPALQEHVRALLLVAAQGQLIHVLHGLGVVHGECVPAHYMGQRNVHFQHGQTVANAEALTTTKGEVCARSRYLRVEKL